MPSAASSLSALKCESPELASSKRGAAEEALTVRFELVDERLERRAVAEAQTLDVERDAPQRAEARRAAGAFDSLLYADERRQQAA